MCVNLLFIRSHQTLSLGISKNTSLTGDAKRATYLCFCSKFRALCTTIMKTTLCMEIFALNVSMCWHQTRYVLLRYVLECVYSRGFYLKVYSVTSLSAQSFMWETRLCCMFIVLQTHFHMNVFATRFEKEAKSKSSEMVYSSNDPPLSQTKPYNSN